MRRRSIVAVAVLAFAVTCTPRGDGTLAQLTCQSPGIQSESFAYGLHSGYTGQDHRPALRDETCFATGRQAGLNIRTQFGVGGQCEAAYQDGFRQAFTAPQDHLVARGIDACVRVGHRFGLAYLRVNARDLRADIVGASCASAYGAGYQQGASKKAPVLPMDRRDAACYLGGHRWATRAE